LKKIFITFTLFVYILFASSIDLTEDEKIYIKNHEAIPYVYDIDWKPFEYKNDLNFHKGLVKEIINLISKKSGLHFQAHTTYSWDEAVKLVESNQIPMFSAIPFDEKRSSYLNFTKNNILSYNASFVKHNEDKTQYDKKLLNEQLKDKTIAYVKNNSLALKIKKLYPNTKYIELSKTSDGFQAVQNKKADLFLINNITAKYKLSTKYTDLVIATIIPVKFDLKIALQKDFDNRAISIIDKTLRTISQEQIEKIYTKLIKNNFNNSLLNLSNEETKYIKNNTFTVCSQYKHYPISDVKEGKLIGIMGSYFNRISEISGLKFTAIAPNSNEHLTNLEQQGICDLISIMGVDTPRFKNTSSAKAFINHDYILLTSTEAPLLEIDSEAFDSFKYYVHYVGHKKIVKNKYPNLDITVENNLDNIISNIKNNPNSALIYSKLLSYELIQKYGYNKIKENNLLPINLNLATIGVKKDNDKLLSIINKSIEELEKTNTYEILKNSFSKTTYKINELDLKYLLYSVVFILLLISVIILLTISRKKIQKEKEKFSDMFYLNATKLMIVSNEDRSIVDINKASCDFYGYERNEFLKLHVTDINTNNPADFKILTQKIDKELNKKRTMYFQTSHKLKDGTIKQVEISTTELILDGKSMGFCIINDITEKKKQEQEILNLNANLESKVNEQVNILREQELMLIHQDRLAQLGNMISMIAHQWRQPLAAISVWRTNAFNLIKKREQYDNKLEMIEEKLKTLEVNLTKTIDDFKNFYKEDKEKHTIIISEVINEAVKIVEHELINKNIFLYKDFQDNVKTYGSKNELQKVILSLIINAKDELENINLSKQKEINIKVKSSNNIIYIEVSDNGNGIPKDIQNKIFEPYFTTKGNLNGSGLGLYMCKIIMNKTFEGDIKLQSKANEPAKFVLELPVKKEETSMNKEIDE